MKQAISILKFGGTSVGSGERIRQVATIVTNTLRDPNEAFPVVVVSAMSGVTDQLLRIARFTCLGEYEESGREYTLLRQKHLDAAEVIANTPDTLATARDELEAALRELQRDITRLREATEQGSETMLPTAAVASWGERLSVLLVSAALRAQGVEAEAVRREIIVTSHPDMDTSVPFGIVVGADPIMDQTRTNAHALIDPLLARQSIPVAAGFIGRTVTGHVITLGRNGSDYSASVIGAALDCTGVSIYTDVDGVLSADPRLVKNARLLPQLSYAEAARLSWFGAKVLHPRTLIPLASRNIPVRVRNTFHPQNRGTVVGPVGRQPSGAAAITIRRNLALLTVESTDLFGAPENAGQVFALAARAGAAPVAICSSSGHHLSFVVEEQAAQQVVEVLQHELQRDAFGGAWQVRSRSGLAACACIGSGFTSDPMSPARAITALARERISIITQGASELGIVLIVEDRDSQRALRSLHRDLIAPVIPLVRHGHAPTQEKRRDSSKTASTKV
jgi:aspartate kinase